MWANPQFPVDFVAFTEESLMGNFIFCAVIAQISNHCYVRQKHGKSDLLKLKYLTIFYLFLSVSLDMCNKVIIEFVQQDYAEVVKDKTKRKLTRPIRNGISRNNISFKT